MYNKLCVVARFRPKSDAVEYQVRHSDERPIEAGQSEMMSQTRFTAGMFRTNSPLPAVEGHTHLPPTPEETPASSTDAQPIHT